MGLIARQEYGLVGNATLLMLIVVIPVFALLFFFAWHYRASNTKAKYVPDWENAPIDELIWWAVPLEIVLVLAALTWGSSHTLDPHKSIATSTPEFVVDVVALPWKWLFIYPAQNIATVNYLALPTNTPVTFYITADAPMNSFWIPQLGGQIYAMTGMVTTLHLATNGPGDYQGMSANYSGEGFTDMRFDTRVLAQSDFDAWAAQTKTAPTMLTPDTYALLSRPATSSPQMFSAADPALFNSILDKYDWGFIGGHHH